MGAYKTIKSIYKPKYIVLNIILAIAYYTAMTKILIAAYHIVIFVHPLSQYLFYTVAVTSSIMLTIGIYAFGNTVRNKAKIMAPTVGSVVALTASVFTSCGCTTTLALLILTAIGLSGSEALSLGIFISNNESMLLFILILINLFVITYYINRLSKRYCRPSRKRKR